MEPKDCQTIRDFFHVYANRVNAALSYGPPGDDVEGTIAAFADAFVEASPAGVVAAKNDRAFRHAIPRGLAFYRQIGTQAMIIRSLDLTPLDARHAVAAVHWHAAYVATAIDFTVFYVVQLQDGRPKIFAYVTGDEQQALKDHGLLPT